ncbi:hypothetical protein ACOMHN_047296 [Nucella lapillus]
MLRLSPPFPWTYVVFGPWVGQGKAETVSSISMDLRRVLDHLYLLEFRLNWATALVHSRSPTDLLRGQQLGTVLLHLRSRSH